jgi:hypothetical protein
MAFNMKRPVIKGTPLHKASVAKAKAKSIVSQRRTQADAGLVSAANTLGKSYKPQAIDFELDKIDIDVPEKKEKKEKQPKVKKEKKVKVKKEKNVKVKKEKGDNIFEKGYKSIKDFIKEKNQKKLYDRLKKAEEGPDSDYDFSEIDNEPNIQQTKKAKKYKSPEAGTKKSEELLSRTKASRNKKLQDAAKKYGVKVKDLEAKEIGGKKEFFPKQAVVGGKDKTQWSDEKGRFLIPSGGYSDEEISQMSSKEKAVYEKEMDARAQKAVDEANKLKPTQDNIKKEDLSDMYQMIQNGDIALNKQTNSYEYTDVYKKTQATINNKNNTQVKPVVEEKETENKGTGVFINGREVSEARLKALDKDYEKAGPNSKKNYIKDGYKPKAEREGKSPMEMRDNRIYRNAVKGGTVQQTMIKSGYIPE